LVTFSIFKSGIQIGCFYNTASGEKGEILKKREEEKSLRADNERDHNSREKNDIKVLLVNIITNVVRNTFVPELINLFGNISNKTFNCSL